jgi:probable phosphoglycerate mutase
MKWPNTLTVVRHEESAYNALRERKKADPVYREFLAAYERRREDPDTVRGLALALVADGGFLLGVGDHDTGTTERGAHQAETTGRRLSDLIQLPDVIFVSPYKRTRTTLGHMAIGWPALADVRTVEEERIREQEHGLSLLYNDWRIFNVLHPEQEQLRELEGEYWYRYPQGENVPDVRERVRSWTGALTRDYSGQNVLAVTHHLSILGLRANFERFGAEEFLELNEQERPVNCGATIYRGAPDQGSNGRLLLDQYNVQLY